MKKNYKSDFDALLRLRTCAGDGDALRELGWPDYDWTARFYTTNKANAYVAECRGGVCRNCFNDGGRIHVVFNDHGLGLGRLNVEFSAELPDAIYPDGSRLEVTPQPMDVELVQGRGDCGTAAELEVLLPYIKGDAFTYADFTAEQIAELQRPALEAAGAAQKVIEDADGAVVLLESALAESALATNAATVAAERAETAAETVDASVRDAAVATAKANDAAQKAESAVEGISAELDKKADKEAMREALAGKQDVLMTSADVMVDNDPDSATKGRLSVTDRAKYQWMIEVFNYLANRDKKGYGGFNEETGFFELGTVKDLTYEDAMTIVLSPQGIHNVVVSQNDKIGLMSGFEVRALFPIKLSAGASGYSNFNRRYDSCTKLEEAVFIGSYGSFVDHFFRAFAGCRKLRVLTFETSSTVTGFVNTFDGCVALEELTPPYAAAGMDLSDCSRLSLESLVRIVSRTSTGKNITHTVHPTVYAKLTDETNAEWHAVLTEALSKNISFATI